VQHYNAPGDGGARVLNASVMVVGVLGVYGAFAAVYLAIAGFSLRFAGRSAQAAPVESATTKDGAVS
jgi:hypothetical protein